MSLENRQVAMVRGLGPSLTGQGVPNALGNPTLELHDGNGSIIAANDNWKEEPNAAEIRSLGQAPAKRPSPRSW
ncbi:MAG: hypothetical protein LC753_08770 [Acidobacteria bacterium]|nr:hypothetical protein [Acidobacteriota bacterium]